jgi:hypothetical protein
MKEKKYSPGDVITLRLPKDLQEKDLQGLNDLKSTLNRDFNKVLVPLFLETVNDYVTKENKEVSIPLPQKLTTEQESRFNQPMIKELIGQLVYQLIVNPAQPINISGVAQEQKNEIEETPPSQNNEERNDNFNTSYAANFIANNMFDDDDDDD